MRWTTHVVIVLILLVTAPANAVATDSEESQDNDSVISVQMGGKQTSSAADVLAHAVSEMIFHLPGLNFKDGPTPPQPAAILPNLDDATSIRTANELRWSQRMGNIGAAQIYMRRIRYADPKRVVTILSSMGLVSPADMQLYADSSVAPVFAATTNNVTNYSFINIGKVGQKAGTVSTPGDNTAVTDLAVTDVNENYSTTSPRYVVIRCADGDWPLIDKAIDLVDTPPTMIDLEVRICEVSKTNLVDLGTHTSGVRNINGSESLTGDALELKLSEQNDPRVNGRVEPFALGDYYRSGADLLLTLNTLIKSSQADLLASPVLSAIDGQRADYFAGEMIPYADALKQTTGTTPTTVSLKRVGVYMSFVPQLLDTATPYMNVSNAQTATLAYRLKDGTLVSQPPSPEDQEVLISVKTVVSSIGEELNLGPIRAFRIKDREASSQIRIKNGDTYCLAGLILTNDVRTWQKVPVLGDVPLIGKLFRSKDFRKERSDVLIFITPHIRPLDCPNGPAYMYGE